MNKVIKAPSIVPRLDQIIELTNGKKVANFSSPHPFTFEDGSVLPAVSKELALHLQVEFKELPLNDSGDIALEFELSDPVIEAMGHWQRLYDLGAVNVVFCPLPMMTALKEQVGIDELADAPFRSIRRISRCENIISITKQCI